MECLHPLVAWPPPKQAQNFDSMFYVVDGIANVLYYVLVLPDLLEITIVTT